MLMQFFMHIFSEYTKRGCLRAAPFKTFTQKYYTCSVLGLFRFTPAPFYACSVPAALKYAA